MPDFLPRGDAALVAWAKQFVDFSTGDAGRATLAQTASPTLAGRFDAVAEAYARFASLYRAMTEADTRTPSIRATKDSARREMVALIRPLATHLRGFPELSSATFIHLGLRVPNDGKRSRLSAPKSAPLVALIAASGRAMTVRLSDADAPSRRARPRGTMGAVWFTATGEDGLSLQWQYGGQATRTVFAFDVPASVPLGATVWFVAQWAGSRAQAGPLSTPLQFTVGEGTTLFGTTRSPFALPNAA